MPATWKSQKTGLWVENLFLATMFIFRRYLVYLEKNNVFLERERSPDKKFVVGNDICDSFVKGVISGNVI